MNRNEALRAVRKGSLVLAKEWVDSREENPAAEDVLRIIRNRIWDKYGPDELAELETEIDLGL